MNDGTGPKVTWYGRGLTFYHTEAPPGLPRAETQVAAMFRLDDQDPPPPILLSVPAAERTALLMSIASTFTRTNYHRHRFTSIVELLGARREAVRGLIVGDLHSSSALYEATAMLAGARSFVDEVAYLAARRAGANPDDADRKWSADNLIKADLTTSTKFAIDETRILHSRKAWFEELNVYRNLLIHRGWKDTPGAGYYPPGFDLREAKLPHMNIMLIPDIDSIGRPSRADSWRYASQARLEDLVDRVWNGLESFATDIGICWGLTIPAAGAVPMEEQPTMMLIEPLPSLVAAFGYTYVPVFSDKATAERFREQCYGSASIREIIELQRSTHICANWNLHLPCGDSVVLPLGVTLNDSIKVPLDPVYNPRNGAILYTAELANTSLSTIRKFRGPYYELSLSGATLGSLSALYYLRQG